MTTVARGWLNKSHKGSQARREKRWFVSDGFAVNYSKTEDPTTRTGRFDLRQVESIDEAELGELVITIKGKAHALHIYLSDAEPADAALFRRLWASGVDASAVRPTLQPHRSVVLASRFRDKHGSQVTPSYSSSSSFSLSRGPSWYSSKTPRQGQPPLTSGGREWPSARASTHELGGGSEGDEEASLEEASLPAAPAVPRPSGIPLINLSAISDAEAKKAPAASPMNARSPVGPMSEAQLEVARQEWLVYLIKTELFQNALELAVTDAEEMAIKQAQHDAYEPRRREWQQYYLAHGQHQRAMKLVANPEERAMVLAHEKAHGSSYMRCLRCVA